MIVHTIVHNNLEDFAKTMIDEKENIVGYYLELHKNGNVRGSYITDNRYPAQCKYSDINKLSAVLSQDKNRVWKNIPIELYLETYKSLVMKECGKMHRKWEQVPYDDLYQMFCEAVTKCYNKNGYILNSRLVLRTFYNTVYTFIRHNFNSFVNTVSIEEPICSNDGEEVSIMDTIEDESNNPDLLDEQRFLEEDKIEKLNLIQNTLKELGYSERIYNNILFELEKHAQSRETRRIIERIRERLSRDGWI